MKFLCALTVVLLFPDFLSAQLHFGPYAPFGGFQVTTGLNSGYLKYDANHFYGKQTVRMACSAQLGPFNQADGAPVFMRPYVYASNVGTYAASILNNLDSTFIRHCYIADGQQFPMNPGQHFRVFYLNARQKCDSCYFNLNPQSPYADPFVLYRRNYEYYLDTPIYSYPPAPLNAFIPASMPSFTFYQGFPDLTRYLMAPYFRNMMPYGGVDTTVIHPYYLYSRYSHYHSRIFRFQDYPNINSPDVTNPQTILGVQGKTTTWNPGIVDEEGDSIAVRFHHLRMSTGLYHPNWHGGCFPPQLSAAGQDSLKQLLRDSSQNIAYKPGYNPAQPFGNNAIYSLNPSSGQISFAAPDTGLYLLSYLIEEYRDGVLLGDIMNVRVAIVRDSTGITLPQFAPLQNISGGSYNPNNGVLTVCAGQTVSFNTTASSTLADAELQAGSNVQFATPGAQLTTTYNAANNISYNFNWQTADSNNGFHYLYLDVVDTACGPNHLPAHQNTGIVIHVISQPKILAQEVLCKGDTLTLIADGGYNFSWSVMPGGDPQLNCGYCSWQQLTPDSTTTYVLQMKAGSCIAADTLTVTVVQPFSVQCTDTAFGVNVPAGYVLGANVSPAGNYYQYAWTPAAAVSNPNILNPAPLPGSSLVNYVLTVTDTAGCFMARDTLTLNIWSASVLEPGSGAFAANVRVWPNPTSKEVRVSANRAGVWTLSDALGRTVATTQLAENGRTEKLVIGDLLAGVYVWRFVSQREERVVGKLIVR